MTHQPMRQPPARRYIGDGVYVEWSDPDLILTTENGGPLAEATNTIVLEPQAIAELNKYCKAIADFIRYKQAEVL